MDSLWSEGMHLPQRKMLEQDAKTDVLIIGGGIAGILCAYRLQQAGVDYMLVEAERICSGITKNTTAKITVQHGLIYDKLIRQAGTERARMYLEVNELALRDYVQLCREIDCSFEEKDSYVYSRNDRDLIEKEIRALEKLGRCAEFSLADELPFAVAAAVKMPRQAQFHPLKFLSAIAKDLNLYENTKVCELIGNRAITNRGTITAEKMIATTHFPFLNKHGSYFIKQYQHRSYVIAYANAQQMDGMYVDEQKKGMSFRAYDDLLLIGGGSHRTGKKGGNWQELSEFADRYYPRAKETFRWATQDCMTLDGVPYIGRYSARTSDFYVATGFNKWGMTSSMAAARILTDMVLGRNSEFAEVFSPSRSMFHPQLLINGAEAVVNLLTPSGKRCPHLGCALKWNPQERSWDCPCHGSRFDEDGTLIDNPATGDLT